MVNFEGQRGSIGGYGLFVDRASDVGAQVTFDDFGSVVFNINGYGENPACQVQLQKEYGRYFCSTAVCGGFKNWVSSLGTVTPRITAGDVYVKVIDDVTKDPVAKCKASLGLMSKLTDVGGEAYLGKFAFGEYPLSFEHPDYYSTSYAFKVELSEHRLMEFLIPKTSPHPIARCEDVHPFLRPFCVFIIGVIEATVKPIWDIIQGIIARLDDFERSLRAAVNNLEEAVAGLKSNISSLRSILNEEIKKLLGAIDKEITERKQAIAEASETLWTRINILGEELWTGMDKLGEELWAGISKEIEDRKKAIDEVWEKLEAWLIERIVGILLKGLDREVEEMEAKK